MDLYLVRHGAASNVAGRCIGHCDVPLSETGAEAIDRLVAILPERPDHLVASDLTRATESARRLAQQWQLPVTHDPRLREMSFGEWEGRLWSDLERDDNDRVSAWMRDWAHARAPGGESFEDVVARAGDWLAQASAAWRGKTVVVVAHAGAIRAILCLWLALPLDWAFRFRIDPASVSVLRYIG